MIVNKEGKLFGKVSIVDFVIVLCVVLAVAAIGAKFVLPNASFAGGAEKTCEYTMIVQGVRMESVEAIEKSMGQKWYDVKDTEIGEIKEIISVTPYKDYIYASDGSIILAEVPDKYEVRIRMQGRATKGNCSAMLGGKREAMHGSHFTVSSKEITLEIMTADIEFKE